MSADLWDTIEKEAWLIVNFHCTTHEVTLTDDEKDAVQLGLASGMTAALEHFKRTQNGAP